MNTINLAIKNLFSKPLNLLLSLILFSLGVGLVSFLYLFSNQFNEKFSANLAGVDLVIGAKGSPLQLILCNMYHIDNPTGNINIKDAKPFLNPKHPLIKLAVPLSLGDNYMSYRIIGTNDNFLKLYSASIESGSLWKNDLDVTLGKIVADKTNLKVGDTFTSSHGFVQDDDLAHDHAKFKVVGILKPTGAVVDQLILTNTASIWEMHAHEENTKIENHNEAIKEDHDHDDHDHDAEPKEVSIKDEHTNHENDHGHDTTHTVGNSNIDLATQMDKQITSILVQYKSRSNYQALNMPRMINENTAMQAAAPAYEINKLNAMLGTGTETIKYIAILIAIVSMISIFISLYRSMKERKYELAIMRVMGSDRSNLFGLILIEGIVIAIIGWFIGIVLSHIGMAILGKYLTDDFRYTFDAWSMIKEEWDLLAVAICLGALAAIIPAIGAANTDINKTLGNQ